MKSSSKTLFLMMTLMSTIMIMSSSNWMNMWMGLEMNLMSFIPLMSESKNHMISESKMMYFLIQSLASILMITSILINKIMLMNLIKNSYFTMIIQMSMMMKLGMPPFHLWFPEIMNKMKWNMCFMLSTWQKMGPLYIMSKVIENNKTSMIMIMMMTMIGAINGINQTSTRKIISYSSINHMGWLMMIMTTSKQSWMLYMLMYTMLMMMVCMMMYKYNMMYINQMKTFSMKKTDKIIIIMMMMSLGGMPPFLGFLPKMMTINLMMSMNELIIMMGMIMSSLITLYYYMKMSTSNNLLMSNSQKWMNMYNMKNNMFTIMMFMNIMFPMMMMLMF